LKFETNNGSSYPEIGILTPLFLMYIFIIHKNLNYPKFYIFLKLIYRFENIQLLILCR
jgi:hypothetical protein